MTSALARSTENMALLRAGLEDVWFSLVVVACDLLRALTSELSVRLMDTDTLFPLYLLVLANCILCAPNILAV